MDDKLYDLVEKMYIEFSGNFKKIDERFDGIDRRIDGVDQRVDGLEQRVSKVEVMLENDVVQKLEVLFDGQKQMAEQLNRIEEKVNLHDEIIIKRIK